MWKQDDSSNKRMKWEEDQFDWGNDQNRGSQAEEQRPSDSDQRQAERYDPSDDERMPAGVDSEHRTMGMLCHLAALSFYFGIPFGNFLGPLGIWCWGKHKMQFVDYHGKEALNFQICLTMYMIVSGILAFVMIGFPMLAVGVLASFVMPIIAGLKANEGVYFRYPGIVRFIK
jgi:uncharacterized Tic20 family protein